jgi:hypothetical protein
LVLTTLALLSACSWFGWHRRSHVPDPPEIIVTGAPVGSLVFVDGVQTGQAASHSDQSQILDVAAGDHKVEIHVGDRIVYREDTYVGPGEHRVVMVLSGLSR